ncbi:MAG: TetR family transcriptional regulator [Dehalococcoidia bacterium]
MNSDDASRPAARPATRPGRRPAASGDTRAAILEAARALFAAHGFRGATTRRIAQRAGVDVALLHHHFGSKAELFEAAVGFPRIGAEIAATFASDTDDGMDAAERVARLYLDRLFVDEIETFSAMLRTAVGSPGDIPTMRQALQGMLQRLAAQVGGGRPRSPLAFELIGAQMIGVLVLRHLVQIEPIASAPTDEMVRHLAPAFRAILQAGLQPDPEERSA